jgi:hypothetical protein
LQPTSIPPSISTSCDRSPSLQYLLSGESVRPQETDRVSRRHSLLERPSFCGNLAHQKPIRLQARPSATGIARFLRLFRKLHHDRCSVRHSPTADKGLQKNQPRPYNVSASLCFTISRDEPQDQLAAATLCVFESIDRLTGTCLPSSIVTFHSCRTILLVHQQQQQHMYKRALLLTQPR